METSFVNGIASELTTISKTPIRPLQSKKICRSLLLCLVLWLTSPFAQASMWMDPQWEEMLKDSELIALVEVIEGGRFIAKVRVLTTFKGSAAPEFYVTEFNNHAWPAEAIEIETFKEKDRYYLFARREKDMQSLEFLAGAGQGFIQVFADFIAPIFGRRSSSAEFRPALKAAKKGLLWSVWTPTAGDLPVEGERVRYSLLSTGYSRYASARDRAEFEEFLKAAVAYHVETQTAPALLDHALQAVRAEAAKPVASRDSADAAQSDQPSDLSHWLAMYLLCGGRAYDEVFKTIATGPDDNARFILARLLGSIHDERAGQLLLVMLKDASSIVQGEVVRQLAKNDPGKVGSVLLDALAEAGEGGIYPQSLMDPVRNQLDGGKIEIVRALGELKYEPAASVLITLLEGSKGEYDLKVIAEALEKMGNRDYASVLEKALGSGKIRVYEIANWARDHRLTHLKPAFERLLANPPPDTSLTSVVDALGIIGDDATAAQLTAYLEKLNAKKVAEFEDQQLAQELIGALGALRYKPARSAVEQSFFYWFGIDSTFAANPELVRIKRRLERKIERNAGWYLEWFTMGWARTLVFLENRGELSGGSATKPKYRFVLHVDVFSCAPSHAKAEALRSKLVEGYAGNEGTIGVTLQNFSHYIFPSRGNDARVNGRNDGLFLWRYGQYVQAVHELEDVRFVKFLLESGLAQRWGAEGETMETFKSISDR